jgi:hypothetical protein
VFTKFILLRAHTSKVLGWPLAQLARRPYVLVAWQLRRCLRRPMASPTTRDQARRAQVVGPSLPQLLATSVLFDSPSPSPLALANPNTMIRGADSSSPSPLALANPNTTIRGAGAASGVAPDLLLSL